MAREVERLSAKTVEKAKQAGYYHDGAGLYLQVSESRSKSWIFRYTLAGKTREMGLGSFNAFSLADARERARAQRKLLTDGVDPIAARAAGKAQEAAQRANSLSFKECAEKYIAANRAGWRNEKHGEQWANTLDAYAYPVIGAMPAQAIDTGHVMRVLEPIWTTKPETATRVRGRIERVLDWARVQKYRDGDNPARWRGHLDKLLPKRSKVARIEHHPALPYQQVPAFLQALRQQPGTAPRALEATILAAARTNEMLCAKPAEFDLQQAVWTIPADRMKAGKEHRVTMSPRLVQLVRNELKAHPDAKYVFPGRWPDKPMTNGAMLMTLERMKRGDITVHGFRSSFRDWAGETTSHPREVIEHALAHQLKDKAEAAYQRGTLFDKRRKLMADWARYCETPKAAGKVLALRRRAP